MLTAEELRRSVSYDRETGEFIRLPRSDRTERWNRAFAGKRPGRYNKAGYLEFYVGGKLHYAHRLAWLYVTGEWPKEQIDHINQKKGDNRLANLREASASDNSCNQPKRPTAKYPLKGMTYCKSNKAFHVEIRRHRKVYSVGYFKCPAAAHFAYVVAAEKLHGEFAHY